MAVRVVGVRARTRRRCGLRATTTTRPSALLGPGDGGRGHLERNLTLDHRGKDVKALQRRVGAPVTGVYDDVTADAVQLWQAARGLPATGYWGPMSRAHAAREGKGRLSNSTFASTSSPAAVSAGVDVAASLGLLAAALSFGSFAGLVGLIVKDVRRKRGGGGGSGRGGRPGAPPDSREYRIPTVKVRSLTAEERAETQDQVRRQQDTRELQKRQALQERPAGTEAPPPPATAVAAAEVHRPPAVEAYMARRAAKRVQERHATLHAAFNERHGLGEEQEEAPEAAAEDDAHEPMAAPRTTGFSMGTTMAAFDLTVGGDERKAAARQRRSRLERGHIRLPSRVGAAKGALAMDDYVLSHIPADDEAAKRR